MAISHISNTNPAWPRCLLAGERGDSIQFGLGPGCPGAQPWFTQAGDVKTAIENGDSSGFTH